MFGCGFISRLHRHSSAVGVVILVLGFMPTGSAPAEAQANSTSPIWQYSAAVARARRADRIHDLEVFVSHATGPLRKDALEFLIWEGLSAGDSAHALMWANGLRAAENANPIALAVICDNALSANPNKKDAELLLKNAQQGIDLLPQLRRPSGMSAVDFAALQRQTTVMLKGASGYAHLQLNQDADARADLREAVALDSTRVRDRYALAVADLSGKDQDKKEGYWELARTVDLSRGTSEGNEIAQYARGRYIEDGGSNDQWNQFLEAAAASNANDKQVLNASAATASGSAATSRPVEVAQAPTQRLADSATIHTAPRSSASTTAAAPPPSAQAAQPEIIAKAAAPPPPAPAPASPPGEPMTYSQPPVRPRRVSTGPMSLGILIETSLANKETRRPMLNALTDMVRRMNDADEAFILTYDNQLVFEQDLTTDPKQLEDAMDQIKPQKGAALEEAVAFAAGHLARIAKYPNRVLLVISDGADVNSHAAPVRLSEQINAAGVRIYCIGMDIAGENGRYRLQVLAQRTGGHSEFISSPGEFRQATKEIAMNLGISF